MMQVSVLQQQYIPLPFALLNLHSSSFPSFQLCSCYAYTMHLFYVPGVMTIKQDILKCYHLIFLGDADDHILSHEERCNSREIGTESTTTHNLWTEKKHFCRGEPFVLLYNSSTQHNQTHSCKKPGSCDTCQKHFSRRYSCNICKQSFSRKYSLDRHKNRHTGEKIYTCDTCEKCFFRKDKLIRHKRLHTGEKPYSCVTCQKDFSRKDNFDCHKRTHTVFMRHT